MSSIDHGPQREQREACRHDHEDQCSDRNEPFSHRQPHKPSLTTERNSGRGPLLEFNEGSHPGDDTFNVNAKDMLSLSLLQARLIDLKMPIKIVEGT